MFTLPQFHSLRFVRIKFLKAILKRSGFINEFIGEKVKPKRRKYSIGRRLVGTREQNLYPTEKWINCFI